MKSYKVAVIPGDGIGVEVVKSSIDVLNALQEDKNFKLEFHLGKHFVFRLIQL